MILVTGGAGYIGSHCVLALLERGCDVVVFDNLSTGHIETIEKLKIIRDLNFVQGDLLDKNSLDFVFKNNSIDAVIHFAAFSQVGESVKNPQKYYINNVCGTLNLLEAMLNNNVKRIVFSSTAATYGEPKYIPIDEKHPQEPINPYGQTKLMIEKIMEDYDKAYGLKSVRLRYFNVAGADSDTRIGEWHEPETHLIPNILKSIFSDNKEFCIFGTDYNTKDGTCVRDYINVEDLANAHILALEYLLKGGETNFFNLGTNEGNSVQEVFETCKDVIGKTIPVKIMERRAGDPASLVADNKKVLKILGWKPKRTLKESIKSAYEWEKTFKQLLIRRICCMPKVSILVPIYNVEKYLRECLDSLINQTLQDIEIICINDGSTDNSLEIINEYRFKDKRIKLINKENSGYGHSMNMGLAAATGEYVGIVESDDFAAKNMFEELYKLAVNNQVDLVKSQYYCYKTLDKEARKSTVLERFNTDSILNIDINPNIIRTQPCIWTAIYKKEFLDKYKIGFVESKGASYQDTAFAFKVLALAERIIFTKDAYLYYRTDNENSSVHSKDKVFAICGEYKEITDFLNNHPNIKRKINVQKLVNEYVAYDWNLGRIDKQFKPAFITKMSELYNSYDKNQELNEEFYKRVNRNEIKALLKGNDAYTSYFKKNERRKKFKEFRKKLISIRISFTHIDVVLFGKQIIKVGK